MNNWRNIVPGTDRPQGPCEYWMQIDPENGNPLPHTCWAYYDGDTPVVGHWVKVRETGETNKIQRLLWEKEQNETTTNK